MGQVYREFELTMARFETRYRGHPRREILRLLLLALEREQLVSIAYRDDRMRERLETLALSDDLRAIMRQSLAWAWRDEQMHAIYTRGLLLRIGSPALRARAVCEQIAGAVGGWSSSVRQHVSWREAPFSRAAASLAVLAGRSLGKVPRALKTELELMSFQRYCELQADAERTAAACWRRIGALAREWSDAPPGIRAEFARMERDEERHERVFTILERTLDRGDRPRDCDETAIVAEKLRAVGEPFVPREHRSAEWKRHPLGGGGPVWVVQGAERDEKRAVFRQLLDSVGLPRILEERARALGKEAGDLGIVIKATFMLGYDRRDTSLITDPELLEELALYLREQGCRRVIVADGRNIYDRFFAHRTVPEVARYFGIESPHYTLVDMTEDQVAHEYSRGLAQGTIARCWREADVRIAFAKLRSHPVDFSHLTLAGLQGVGTRLEDFLFAERQAHRDAALLMPAAEFPPDLALIDGYDSAADGVVGIIACPRAPRPRRFYAGTDALAVDLVATRHMGLADPHDCAFLMSACHWFGDPTESISIRGVDVPIPGWRDPYHDGLSRLLCLVSSPMYEFASGRGAVFVPPMDPGAFPPLGRESTWLKLRRAFVRRLLRMRAPA
jgi:uncharacterized protein (DUF362 family)